MNKKALLMSEKDSVATVIDEVNQGEVVDIIYNGECQMTLRVTEDIDYYHKFAIHEIKTDDKVYKYGEVIGKATQAIGVGDHVHVHNIESVMTI